MSDCGTVLVIDRDPAFLADVDGALSRLGCSVLVAGSGEDGLALLAARPALAVVEVELPGLNGLAVLRELQERYGDELPVVLVSAEHVDSFDRTAGLLVGADDYLVKPVDTGELAARARRLLRRSGALPNGSGRRRGDRERNGDSNLSPREREILQLLAAGRSQKEIAEELVLSSKTVSTHIQHVLSKLRVHSRAEAVAAAYRRGLVDADVVAHAQDAALVGAD